ncbi:CDP-diacylglycerol--glycerol-3-phosphate 3-phosphatidyltransferase [Mycolicibacterium iranicum]|uniref:CDP-diacylglycerol--glycerol-3-phosphate 3-phosphatidyltransferase n=1 Tax=Mycolicibacterium iranicum TaxID=912594 RepID=A0A839QDB8_MYCIR|nr:CDP-alcohol phosphatidyltransferase family protein [Mycolicibacterium iranicum]MBB2992186.1 CDP-diacylglycerol--glycerol-3-phosphate 3-phosphatidyltransferase [Mycolicibacterium iranicum]
MTSDAGGGPEDGAAGRGGDRAEDGAGDRADDSGWSALHGGVQPSPVVRGWLRMIWALAAGPVLRIRPDVLSALGVLTLVAGWAVTVGPGWPALTGVLVIAAGVIDGLDGAVALRTGRARPLGAVVDAVADRLGDLVLGAILVALGAALPWVLAALALLFVMEYLRARAQSVGMPGVGAVTVAERPTRLILVAMAAFGTAAVPAGMPLLGWGWATALTVTWTVVGLVGMGQLVAGVRRTIPPAFPPDR